jgi:hypothetical protein
MFQMAHDSLGRDPSHVLVSLMDPLATAELQRECDGVGEVARIGGCELLAGVGHG